MDRFGDDLTELILSFLWFEDKIRLECVSKQWKRCVFQRQVFIKIGSDSNTSMNYITDDSFETIFNIFHYDFFAEDIRNMKKQIFRIDNTSLKSLLKKCPNITNVRLYLEVKNEVLSLFGQYCPNIKSLIVDTKITIDDKKNDKYLSFFRKNGHKLRELIIDGSDEVIERYLRLCPNVKLVNSSPIIINEDKEFLPNLQHIVSSKWCQIKSTKDIKVLSDKYCQTSKTLEFNIAFDVMEEKLKTFGQNFRFNDLRKVCLAFQWPYSGQAIDDCLSMIVTIVRNYQI